MTLLCIETSTHVCSAALCKDGAVIEQLIEREDGNHARLLPRYIEQLLHTAKERKLSIDAVALSEGPGSYTGLRIGTSTAKGLCYGLNVPLIPVPTLEILCAAAKDRAHIDSSALLCPMIDARRMEVYTAMFGKERGEKAKAVVVESTDSLNAQPSTLNIYYFGDGAEKCQTVLAQPNWHFIPDIVPEARYMAHLAEQERELKKGNDLAYYEPFYLKEFVAAQSHVKGLN